MVTNRDAHKEQEIQGHRQGRIVALCPEMGSKLGPISAQSTCQETELHLGNSVGVLQVA